jgi:hypothetical protein
VTPHTAGWSRPGRTVADQIVEESQPPSPALARPSP